MNEPVTYGNLIWIIVIVCVVNVLFTICSDLVKLWWQRRHPKEDA